VEGFGRERSRETALSRRRLRPGLQALERQLVAELIGIPGGPSLAYLRLLAERLRANQVICIAADGREGQRFQVVEALGRPFPVASGMPSLARSAGAALLPLFCFRNHRGRLQLVIEPPLDVAQPAEVVARRYAALFEGYLRRCPGQLRGWHFRPPLPLRGAALSPGAVGG
jgi:lauroyl/myristoyl acyltransferase